MMTAKCSNCGAELPRRETLLIRDRVSCEDCSEQIFGEYPGTLTQADVVRNLDPTICSWCNSDAGQTQLGEVARVPTCEPCETRMRNWPLPGWIKIAFAALAVLGVLSFLFNVRHVQGFFAARAANRAFQEGKLELAVNRAQLATRKVPEFVQYRLLADLFESIQLLAQEQPAAAMEKLRTIEKAAPHEPMVKDLMNAAEISLAFDQKNYDRFLELAEQQHAAHPQSRQTAFQVASALACKFAETGDDEFRQSALKRLEELGADRDAEETDYRQRIQHRLATRRIIPRREFLTQFPQGWKPEE